MRHNPNKNNMATLRPVRRSSDNGGEYKLPSKYLEDNFFILTLTLYFNR